MFPDFLKALRNKSSGLLRNYPALVILAGILSGSLPFILGTKSLLFVTVFLSIVSVFIFSWRDFLRFSLSVVAGIISVFLDSFVFPSDVSKILPPGDCGSIIECSVADPSCTGPEIAWMENPNYIVAELVKFKYTESDRWRSASGRLYLRLPKEFSSVSYGDLLRLHGYFSDIEKPVAPGVFNMRRFLETRGIRKSFLSFEGAVEKRGCGIASAVGSVRDFLLDKTCENVGDDAHKRILAALIFGCKQGIGKEDRNDFIRSGIIHAFTVSGLHTGILALILCWALRFLPFRPRYLILPFIIFLYVFTTGMQPPAVRAFLVISLVCFFRAFFYYTPVLNSTFLAAALILVVSPLYILDAGFQYSFIITIFLMLAAPMIMDFQKAAAEKIMWVPAESLSRKDFFFYRILKYSIGALLFCSVAWLASSGITLYNQGLYIPSSILANLLMGPFVFCIFVVSIVKLILEPLMIFSGILGSVLDFTVGAMMALSSETAKLSADAALPAPWLPALFVFYIALAILVKARKKVLTYSATAAVFLSVVFWHAEALLSKPRLILTHGDGAGVSAVIAEPAKGRATVFNTPSWGLSMELCNYLKISGIGRLDFVVLQEGKSDYAHGLSPLLTGFDVSGLLLPSTYRRSRSVVKNVKDASDSGVEIFFVKPDAGSWSFDGRLLKVLSSENSLKFEYTVSGLNLSGILKSDGLGRSEFLFKDGKNEHRFDFVNGTRKEFMELELN